MPGFRIAENRSRKPVRVFRSDEGSNPSLSVSRQVAGLSSPRPPRRSPTSTGVSGSDFPATSPRPPLVHPRSTRAWPRSVRRSQDRRSASSFDRNNDEIPRQYWKAPHANGRLPGRREDVLGSHFPTAAPSSSVRVRNWLVTRKEPVFKTGAQRDTPDCPSNPGARGSYACPNKSARSSTHRFLPSEMLEDFAASPPSSLTPTSFSPR